MGNSNVVKSCECPVITRPRDGFLPLDSVPESEGDRGLDVALLAATAQRLVDGGFKPVQQTNGFTGLPSIAGADSDAEDIETNTVPKEFQRPRSGAVFGEDFHKGFYREPVWNKHGQWEQQLFVALQQCKVFMKFDRPTIVKLVRAMEIHKRSHKQSLCQQGDAGDGLFVVLVGSIACYEGKTLAATKPPDSVLDEAAVLWRFPRPYTMEAVGEVIVAKLQRQDYVNLTNRHMFSERERLQSMLRGAKLLEMMPDEDIAKLADVLKVRSFEAGQHIIKQHDEGHEFFIVNSGEARVWVKTGEDEQEYLRYHSGDLFGELALLNSAPRKASVTAVTAVEVLVLSRKQFERLFGAMANLQQQQYLTDPRKLIADFYQPGDGRGPSGSLRLQGLEPEPALGETRWFAVYRPTSRDAIAKMLSGSAVGKGLNVKGKSAKKGVLSGFVPFCQISDNSHRTLIEESPRDSRLALYFKTKAARDDATKSLQKILDEGTLDIEDRTLVPLDEYGPGCFGINLPEPLLRETYIIRADLSPQMGWETGRRSEPDFMDMNMHAIRGKSEPQVVLLQNDESNVMNARGLLIAYAEKTVKPVVSDFDTFTVGATGMTYESLPIDQAKIIMWSLEQTEAILRTPDHNPWTSRWLDVLKQSQFHPHLPKYGFGDPTSYRLIADVVAETSPCGAVRHGAECSNFYFPQELDEDYLVVWHGFPEKPYKYHDEPGVRAFLIDRIKENYAFPMNAVWLVRDKGWYEVFAALAQNEHSRKCIDSWYPPEVGIIEKVRQLREKFPEGFKLLMS